MNHTGVHACIHCPFWRLKPYLVLLAAVTLLSAALRVMAQQPPDLASSFADKFVTGLFAMGGAAISAAVMIWTRHRGLEERLDVQDEERAELRKVLFALARAQGIDPHNVEATGSRKRVL